ncbi:protein vip1-like [Argentina anserina]|uniref:protein vip1-like n=1 Tax=Argentina anserina TaxID=57926 RepID=UPI0021765ABE|nr:protein vip1-like [Potentilla anserina]
MDTEDLTVQVLNLSPRVTITDLITFFSYCGTVHNIQLLRDKQQSPYALVTFGQPYAFQTALLLDDAVFGGKPICILPACVIRVPIESDEDIDESQTKSQGHKISVNRTMEHIATSKGLEVKLKESRDELGESLKLSAEKGRKVVIEQAKSAIYAVEYAAGRMGSAIKNNHFMSNVLDKASRSASDFGIRKKQPV